MTITSPYGIDRLTEQVKGISKEQKSALERECALYASCFSTEAGTAVLNLMERMLESQPTWNPDKDAKYGFYREGQNDVIRHIKNRVNFAKRK